MRHNSLYCQDKREKQQCEKFRRDEKRMKFKKKKNKKKEAEEEKLNKVRSFPYQHEITQGKTE